MFSDALRVEMGEKCLDLSGKGILPRRGVPSWQMRGMAGSCAAFCQQYESVVLGICFLTILN